MINKHIQRLRTAEDGFDLVQALVVVVILGALATIAVLTLLGQAQKGDRASVTTTIQQGVSAAKRLQVEGGGTSAAWRTGIAGSVQSEIRASLPAADATRFSATGGTTSSPTLVISYNRSGSGCQADMTLNTTNNVIDVSYSTPTSPTGLTNGCP